MADHVSPNAPGSSPFDTQAVTAVIEREGPTFVAGRRWFGSKSRRIERVVVDDIAVDEMGDEAAAVALARLEYVDGGEDRYALPVMLTRAPGADSVVIGQTTDGLAVVDGPEEERFRGWFLDGLADGRSVMAERGELRFEPTDVLGDYLAAARTGASRLVRSEQSNSSVIYGDAIIGKLFRRLQPGVNPDLEIGRFLTTETDFRAAPPLVGGVSWIHDDGSETSIAILQVFVPSAGDAWTATLAELATLTAPGQGDGPVIDSAPAALLGRRTGQLHVALASSESDPAFAPRPVTPDDVAAWERETIASIERQRAMLDNALPRLSPAQQQMVVAVDLSPNRLAHRVGGYRALEGTVRIRVHGDYHLGQVLRSLTGDVVLLDFEGEPARTIEERREPTAALKDVAGMLRSFRYARAAALRAQDESADLRAADQLLAQWEQESRDAFLAAYRAEIAASPQPIAPADDAAFAAGLDAWELDKALYELAYEANNRPTWLDVPLLTLAM